MSKKQQFLEQVTVLDTETTGLNPQKAEIVELATARWENQSWSISSALFNALNGVPPESSAKNGISQRMVQDRPYFDESMSDVIHMLGSPRYFVAHNTAYDQPVMVANLTQAGEWELAEMFRSSDIWICTWRISRRIYQHSFTDQIYGQNYLRYRLDLPVPDSVGVHRAGDDVGVCAVLLERLIDDGLDQGILSGLEDLGPQLVRLTQEPIPVLSWPTGKHKGVALRDVPTDYYLWALDKMETLKESNPNRDRDLLASIQAELESRV